MNMLNIAYYGIIRNLRDRQSLSLMILLPLMSTLILGTALSSSFNTVSSISKTTICYINEDEGWAGEAFHEFINSEDVKSFIELKEVSTYEEGVNLIRDRKATSIVMIDSDFSQNLNLGEQVNIKVYNSQYSNYRASIVKSLIDSFINTSNSMEAIKKLSDKGFVPISNSNIEEVPISITGKLPRAIDYYAVTMLVMSIMYGTIHGANLIAEDRYQRTEIRLKSSPLKNYQLFLGRLLATITTLILQVFIIIGCTKYVFKANWGNNMPFILFTCFSAIIMAVGIGIMVYSVFKDAGKVSMILNLAVMIFTFLGGGYFPIGDFGPKTKELASYLSPNYMIQRILFNNIYGGSPVEIQTYLIVIWGITIAAFAISSLAGRRNLDEYF
ncbi:ABC transporter permease [Proteiniborus sp. MB09-C3]|uniref:ABC transporter permease n=1 Tax=Proteiniborus sp. MB09-C3 TaxID=3050072 RepID=UPI0025573387|nr:ABC transporter permease [Proteiniborus sp. MB09-C3]WIV13487.1 ABC transporter permease [Proteiniborus sp. MB09-C3]